MILYHRTTAAVAKKILRKGFRDGVGRYGRSSPAAPGRKWSGVWLSNVPLDINEGAEGDTLLRIELPEQAIGIYEWIEKHKPYREWMIPAQLVNEQGTNVVIVEDE